MTVKTIMLTTQDISVFLLCQEHKIEYLSRLQEVLYPFYAVGFFACFG